VFTSRWALNMWALSRVAVGNSIAWLDIVMMEKALGNGQSRSPE